MALLAPIALDLGHSHAVHADRGQGLAHLVELERFDDSDDEFHGGCFLAMRSLSCWFYRQYAQKISEICRDGEGYPQIYPLPGRGSRRSRAAAQSRDLSGHRRSLPGLTRQSIIL